MLYLCYKKGIRRGISNYKRYRVYECMLYVSRFYKKVKRIMIKVYTQVYLYIIVLKYGPMSRKRTNKNEIKCKLCSWERIDPFI